MHSKVPSSEVVQTCFQPVGNFLQEKKPNFDIEPLKKLRGRHIMSSQRGEFCSPAKYWTIEEKCIPCVSPDAIRERAALEINHYHFVYAGEKWCRQRDLNSRPSDYKSDALPTEL